MSNHSIIEHRANYHYLRMEEDYLAICSNGKCSPHCKAQILSVLESWTNTKKEKGEGEYIYLTMPQWIKYTYMLYERNIITDCIKELLEEGFISRRQIVMFDQKTFEYKLMHELVNQRIKELPQKDPKEVLPRLDAYIAYREKAKEQARERREAKKLAQEGVREKSPTVSQKSRTSRVGDKSRTVREKSQEVGDKSTTGYVNNHHILESITNLSLTSTKGVTDNCVAIANANAHATSFSDEPQTSDQHSHPEHEQLTTIDTPKVTNASQPPEIPLQQKEAAKIASQSDENTASSANENSSIQDETDIHIAQEVQKEEEQVKSKGRQSRKPKAPEDPALKERVERVYKFFDKLAEDITGVKDFHYHPTGVSDKAIKNWLKGNPTEELLRDVFAELWNSPPDPRTGFSWQDHMKIPTILKEYDSRVLAIQARRRKQQQASSIATTASHIAGYTRKPDLDDDDFVYESKAEKIQRKRA